MFKGLPPFVHFPSHQPGTSYSQGLMAFLFRKLPFDACQEKIELDLKNIKGILLCTFGATCITFVSSPFFSEIPI
jgi:hypothetical protein